MPALEMCTGHLADVSKVRILGGWAFEEQAGLGVTRVVADQGRDGIEGDDPSVVNDRHPVTQPFSLVHEVRGEHDGRPSLPDGLDHLPHGQPGVRVEAGGEFVEEDHFR